MCGSGSDETVHAGAAAANGETKQNSSSCPQWPDRCCLCFSRTGGVVITGILTILNNICTILLCAYAIVNAKFWDEGYDAIESWIFNNHWDEQVSLWVNNQLILVNKWRVQILSAFICYSCAAIINSMLMVLGVCLQGRGCLRFLLLPWLAYDLLTLSVLFLASITWAFLSFFVHVLVAIIFPIIAGGVLGLYIYLWRNVQDVYCSYAHQAAKQHYGSPVRRKSSSTVDNHYLHHQGAGRLIRHHQPGVSGSGGGLSMDNRPGKASYTMLHSPQIAASAASHRA